MVALYLDKRIDMILQIVNDNELLRRIRSAKSSIVLYATGVSNVVALALCDVAILQDISIKVIFDVSQKSVDMGYLEVEAVKALWKVQQVLDTTIFYHAAGLRLSLLFVDEQPAMVYAPIAKLMEDECYNLVARRPNGLHIDMDNDLTRNVKRVHYVVGDNDGGGTRYANSHDYVPVNESMVSALCDKFLKPAKSLSAIKAECEQRVNAAQQKAAKAEAENTKLKAEMDANVEAKFEEYKAHLSMFRRVELSIHFRPDAIKHKRIKIPSMFLVNISDDVAERLETSFRLFPNDSEIREYITSKYPQENIEGFEEMEKSIREKYLLYLPSFGTYIETKDNKAYEADIDKLTTFASTVGEHIREAMKAKIDMVLEALYKVLSEQWTKTDNKWYEIYCQRNHSHPASQHDAFMEIMRNGSSKNASFKGISSFIDKFKPEIRAISTLVDDTLLKNKDFVAGIRAALEKQHRCPLPFETVLFLHTLEIGLLRDTKSTPQNDGELPFWQG